MDALVLRGVPAFGDVSSSTAIAYRSPGGEETIRPALEATYAAATGPYARGIVARALLDLFEHSGDAAPAALWRERTGCAREATVIGPLDWTPVIGVHAQDPLEAAGAKLAASYAARGVFARSLTPVVARGHGCAIDLDRARRDDGRARRRGRRGRREAGRDRRRPALARRGDAAGGRQARPVPPL